MLGKTTSLKVQTPEGVTFDIPIASPYSRCLALALDLAVILALSVLLSQIIGALKIMLSGIPVVGNVIDDFGNGTVIVFQFLIAIGYGMATEWFWSGQTVGKRLMKLRVIDERGLPLGLKQVIIRNLFRVLDMMPSTFYLLGGLSCLVSRRCQRIGDFAAGTLVIREVEVPPPALEELIGSEKNSFAGFPHLEARLRQGTTPEEARIALDAVTRRGDLNPASRVELFSRLADHFREFAEFPEEVTIGLSDEQYVRNVVETLFRRASV